ncbi:hypothetical protein FocTR4_00013546, partial [Fusarium oxysporum f. sp. cubense]
LSKTLEIAIQSPKPQRDPSTSRSMPAQGFKAQALINKDEEARYAAATDESTHQKADFAIYALASQGFPGWRPFAVLLLWYVFVNTLACSVELNCEGHGDLERALVPLDFLENGFIKMTDLQDIMTSQQIPGVLMTVIIDWYGHESSMQEWFGIL